MLHKHPARLPAVVLTTEGDLVELIARAVAAAMAPVDAQLKMLETEIISMKIVKGIKGPDGMGDISEVDVLTILACTVLHAPGLLVVTVCLRRIFFATVLSRPLVPKRDNVAKSGTEHKCDTSDRQILAARWIGERRHRHIRMRRCGKTHYRRAQHWLVVHWVVLLAVTSLGLFVVSWKIGLVRLLCQDLLS